MRVACSTVRWILAVSIAAVTAVATSGCASSSPCCGCCAGGPVDATCAPTDRIALPTLIVNLADREQACAGRFAIEVALSRPSATLPRRLAAGGDVAASARDVLITVLGSQESRTLKTPDGKETLRAELRRRLDELVARAEPDGPRVEAIHFTELLVQ